LLPPPPPTNEHRVTAAIGSTTACSILAIMDGRGGRRRLLAKGMNLSSGRSMRLAIEDRRLEFRV
jgi:hypothetical protein